MCDSIWSNAKALNFPVPAIRSYCHFSRSAHKRKTSHKLFLPSQHGNSSENFDYIHNVYLELYICGNTLLHIDMIVVVSKSEYVFQLKLTT
jgi:hypothetical protein